VKISDDVGGPSYFLALLPDCQCHVSFRRYSTLSLEVVENPNKCIKLLDAIFWEGRPRLPHNTLVSETDVTAIILQRASMLEWHLCALSHQKERQYAWSATDTCHLQDWLMTANDW